MHVSYEEAMRRLTPRRKVSEAAQMADKGTKITLWLDKKRRTVNVCDHCLMKLKRQGVSDSEIAKLIREELKERY